MQDTRQGHSRIFIARRLDYFQFASGRNRRPPAGIGRRARINLHNAKPCVLRDAAVFAEFIEAAASRTTSKPTERASARPGKIFRVGN